MLPFQQATGVPLGYVQYPAMTMAKPEEAGHPEKQPVGQLQVDAGAGRALMQAPFQAYNMGNMMVYPGAMVAQQFAYPMYPQFVMPGGVHPWQQAQAQFHLPQNQSAGMTVPFAGHAQASSSKQESGPKTPTSHSSESSSPSMAMSASSGETNPTSSGKHHHTKKKETTAAATSSSSGINGAEQPAKKSASKSEKSESATVGNCVHIVSGIRTDSAFDIQQKVRSHCNCSACQSREPLLPVANCPRVPSGVGTPLPTAAGAVVSSSVSASLGQHVVRYRPFQPEDARSGLQMGRSEDGSAFSVPQVPTAASSSASSPPFRTPVPMAFPMSMAPMQLSMAPPHAMYLPQPGFVMPMNAGAPGSVVAPFVGGADLTVSAQTAGKKRKRLRKFACDKCGKRFCQSSNLSAHMRTHTGERPFSCHVAGCDKTFSQSSNLRRHVRLHIGEKPFACPICQKRSSRRGTMLAHMRTHTGEKPFQCLECGKRFAIRNSLAIHTRTYHYRNLNDTVAQSSNAVDGAEVPVASSSSRTVARSSKAEVEDPSGKKSSS